MAHIPGKFVWFELHTQDLAAAQAFYGETVAWKTEPMKMGDGSDYDLIVAGRGPVGGYVKAEGRPHFLSYLSVDDVDQVAGKVKAQGGQVVAEPFSVPGVGRMAVVQDPQGGTFALFKSDQDDAEDAPPGPGDFHWNELWTSDPDEARAFYTSVFGYEVEEMSMPTGAYLLLKAGGVPRAGLMKAPDPKAPTAWVPYVAVDDADATAKRVRRHKGQLAGELMTTPGVGRHGVFVDPQGALVAFITPEAQA